MHTMKTDKPTTEMTKQLGVSLNKSLCREPLSLAPLRRFMTPDTLACYWHMVALNTWRVVVAIPSFFWFCCERDVDYNEIGYRSATAIPKRVINVNLSWSHDRVK